MNRENKQNIKQDILFVMKFKSLKGFWNDSSFLKILFKYTLEFFNQLSINMSEASKLLFTVDKNVTEKEQPIYIYIKNAMIVYTVYVEG